MQTIRTCARLALTGAICFTLAGCPFDSPADHLARAKGLAGKGDHGAAVIELKNALQGNPGMLEARYLLGRELLAQGYVRAAEVELQRAYEGRFDRDKVVPLLVKSQALQGQPDKIPRSIAKITLGTPAANAEVQTWIGFAALTQSKIDDAATAYRAALNFDPTYPAARLGDARIKATRANLDEALAEVDDVLVDHADNIDGLVLKGDILRAKGTNSEAVKTYIRAVELDPQNLAARLMLADSYLIDQNLTLAAPQVAALKRIAPANPFVNFYDALASFIRKDYLHANDAISLSVRDNPSNAPAQVLFGTINLALRQPAQAEVHLIEGIKLNPALLLPRQMLANLYLQQRQPAKAREVLEPALRMAPDNSVLLSQAGEAALQLGDLQFAMRSFEKSATIDTANMAARMQGAAARIGLGDKSGGMAALEAAAKADSADVRPNIALVLTHISARNFDAADAAWKELAKRQPDNPLVYDLRGTIDLGRNDTAAARKAFERALTLQQTYYPAVADIAMLDEHEGNLASARQRFRTLLAKEPKNAVALVALAKLEARNNAPRDVVLPLLQEARRAAPTSQDPVLALAGYYMTQNDPRQALNVVQEGLAIDPKRPAFLKLAGELQRQLGGADQAIAAYRQLVEQRPGEIEYQMSLARAMVQAGQADLAVPVFRNALRARPDAFGAQVVAVDTLISAQKVSEATQLLAEIRKNSPTSPSLPELDGDVKLATRQYAEAAAAYRKVQAQTPSTAHVVKLHTALVRGGSSAEAQALLVGWLNTHPQDTAIRTLDAETATSDRDYARAIQQYKVVAKEKPNDVSVMNNLAFALWQKRDAEALPMAQRAHELAPDRPDISDTLGWMLVEDGQLQKGIDLLRQAATGAPKRGDISLHLAKAQLKDGRKSEARSTLQALLRAAPGSPEAKESRDLLATF